MKITASVALNLNTKAVAEEVAKATRLGMRDTVVDIHADAMRDSPKLTGHNMRSITSEVSGMGTVAQGADAEVERVVDDNKIEGAVYSTSGYGGTLETGSAHMAPRPYFKPALDRHVKNLPARIKEHLA